MDSSLVQGQECSLRAFPCYRKCHFLLSLRSNLFPILPLAHRGPFIPRLPRVEPESLNSFLLTGLNSRFLTFPTFLASLWLVVTTAFEPLKRSFWVLSLHNTSGSVRSAVTVCRLCVSFCLLPLSDHTAAAALSSLFAQLMFVCSVRSFLAVAAAHDSKIWLKSTFEIEEILKCVLLKTNLFKSKTRNQNLACSRAGETCAVPHCAARPVRSVACHASAT